MKKKKLRFQNKHRIKIYYYTYGLNENKERDYKEENHKIRSIY